FPHTIYFLFVCMFLSLFSFDHEGYFRIKPGLRKYACDLTLDPNTAHTQLILSEDYKKTTYVKGHQPYADHPDRFDDREQILCKERLTGRCYWEVKLEGSGNVAITYKRISRKSGIDCSFGFNEKSWSMNCSDMNYTVWYNKNGTDVFGPSARSNRVGVYVDVSAGILSFYSVSDTVTRTHIYTFNTTFSEHLYAGFGVYPESSVSLCQI
ncbi:hypothetical protein cypCar_00048042, partial [Cyprinus carpio]